METFAFVHAWGKGNMTDVSKHVAFTHLALLGWLLLHVSLTQHPGSDVRHAPEQVRGL